MQPPFGFVQQEALLAPALDGPVCRHRRSLTACGAVSCPLIWVACAAMLLAARPLGQPAAGGLLRLLPSTSAPWTGRWAHAAGQLQQCAAYSQPAASGGEAELPPPSGPLVGIKVGLHC